MKEMLAVSVPLAWGVNVKANDAVWPAASVNGNDTPLSVNSELLDVAEETVTLEPAALRVAFKLLLVPTTTLSKPKVVGATPNWPAELPVPEREMDREELAAVETKEMLPVTLPAESGAKATPKVKLCPGSQSERQVQSTDAKGRPVRLAWVMLTLELPELVSVSD